MPGLADTFETRTLVDSSSLWARFRPTQSAAGLGFEDRGRTRDFCLEIGRQIDDARDVAVAAGEPAPDHRASALALRLARKLALLVASDYHAGARSLDNGAVVIVVDNFTANRRLLLTASDDGLTVAVKRVDDRSVRRDEFEADRYDAAADFAWLRGR